MDGATGSLHGAAPGVRAAALVGCGHVRRSRATNDRVRMRVVFCCDVVVGAVSYTLYTAFNLGA